MGEMVDMGSSEGSFVVDVFDIGLDKGKGGFSFPGPQGRVDRLALRFGLRWAVTPQDVAKGVRGKAKSLRAEVEGQTLAAIVRFLPCLQNTLLDILCCLARGVQGATRMILQPRTALLLEASHPLAHYLPGGVPVACCGTDTARLLIGAHQMLSCLNSAHSVYFPVGQIGHRRCSSW